LENGRGGRLGARAFRLGACAFLLCGFPILGWTACPLLPGESKLDFRVVAERRAVELRRHGVPDSAPPLCTLLLDCRVRSATVSNASYTLRGGSILIGDISTMHFLFLDGNTQACGVTEIRQ
jgi:hypothetical protein